MLPILSSGDPLTPVLVEFSFLTGDPLRYLDRVDNQYPICQTNNNIPSMWQLGSRTNCLSRKRHVPQLDCTSCLHCFEPRIGDGLSMNSTVT